MSEKRPYQPRAKRNEIIKDNIAIKTTTEIAAMCGVCRRTIERDIELMKESGNWWQFLERAMLYYGRKDTVSDDTKFREYSRLYGRKFVTEKRETLTAFKGPIVLKWDNSDSSDSEADSND